MSAVVEDTGEEYRVDFNQDAGYHTVTNTRCSRGGATPFDNTRDGPAARREDYFRQEKIRSHMRNTDNDRGGRPSKPWHHRWPVIAGRLASGAYAHRRR